MNINFVKLVALELRTGQREFTLLESLLFSIEKITWRTKRDS